jgi:hypothetical protein
VIALEEEVSLELVPPLEEDGSLELMPPLEEEVSLELLVPSVITLEEELVLGQKSTGVPCCKQSPMFRVTQLEPKIHNTVPDEGGSDGGGSDKLLLDG